MYGLFSCLALVVVVILAIKVSSMQTEINRLSSKQVNHAVDIDQLKVKEVFYTDQFNWLLRRTDEASGAFETLGLRRREPESRGVWVAVPDSGPSTLATGANAGPAA